MAKRNKTKSKLLEQQNLQDYHILVEHDQNVWNAKLEDALTGEVLEFHRPIDLVRWLETRANLEQPKTGLA